MKISRLDAANLIERFLSGNIAPYDWDDFLSGGKIEDPLVESVRNQCRAIPDRFPAHQPNEYCDDDGVVFLRSLVEQLLRE